MDLPWRAVLVVFAASFTFGLILYFLYGRDRRAPRAAAGPLLFDPPPPGSFRLLKVQVGGAGFRVAVLGDFPTFEQAKAGADGQPPADTTLGYVYFSVVDSTGQPVHVHEP